jgi:ATP phosphoribosyltransferase regulatory subunit
VGDLGAYEIAEVLLLSAKTLSALAEEFVLDVSHMGLVSAVLDAMGIQSRDQALRQLSQKSAHELAALCEQEDVDPGKLLTLATLSGKPNTVIPKLRAVLTTPRELEALQELESLCAVLEGQGFGESLRLDFSVGSVMKYYSGVVFKGYLSGIPAAVLSGGQYDRLLSGMGRRSRAIGFAVYADLLQTREEPEVLDTLILHDGTMDPAKLVAMAQQAAEKGSVLVATRLPENKTWKNLITVSGDSPL